MFKRILALIACVAFVVILGLFLFSYMPYRISQETYQTAYEEEVERYSSEFSVDPAFVYAVIKVESNYNPAAVSDAGAIGLMQIIEDSFDWVAWRLGREDLTFEDMYTPEYSIMFGSYMLSYLYDRYGSIELAAAAYHSGMGTVDSWIENGEVDPENVTIDDIQGSNTAHYVKKIKKAYEKYSNK